MCRLVLLPVRGLRVSSLPVRRSGLRDPCGLRGLRDLRFLRLLSLDRARGHFPRNAKYRQHNNKIASHSFLLVISPPFCKMQRGLRIPFRFPGRWIRLLPGTPIRLLSSLEVPHNTFKKSVPFAPYLFLLCSFRFDPSARFTSLCDGFICRWPAHDCPRDVRHGGRRAPFIDSPSQLPAPPLPGRKTPRIRRHALLQSAQQVFQGPALPGIAGNPPRGDSSLLQHLNAHPSLHPPAPRSTRRDRAPCGSTCRALRFRAMRRRRGAHSSA